MQWFIFSWTSSAWLDAVGAPHAHAIKTKTRSFTMPDSPKLVQTILARRAIQEASKSNRATPQRNNFSTEATTVTNWFRYKRVEALLKLKQRKLSALPVVQNWFAEWAGPKLISWMVFAHCITVYTCLYSSKNIYYPYE